MTRLYTFSVLALAATIGLSSCSSSKSSQGSPDFYSSGKTSGSDYVAASPNDQYVQMKADDYARWSYFDDYDAYDAYYAPAPMYGGMGMGYGMGYGMPYYGFGYSPFYGPSFGMGLGFGDPYMMWDSYFIWNSWYNPYFYNPYYGGAVMVAKGSPTSLYSNLRPFENTNYKNGLAHVGVTGSSRNVVYRPGMSATTAYNSHVRNVNSFRPYRPVNNSNGFRNFNSTRSFEPARSFGGGGGFHSGGFGGGRH